MNKKGLFILILSALFAVASIVLGFKYSASQTKKINANALVETKVKDNQKESTVKASDLFADDHQVFLAKDISDKKISEIRKAVKENDSDTKLVESAKVKWNALKEVNSLFDNPVLEGKKLTGSSMKNKTTKADIDRVSSIVSDLPKDGFKKALQSVLSDEGDFSSEDSSTDSTTSSAQALVSVLVTDGVVHPSHDFTYDDYANALSAVASLPEGSEKDDLSAQMDKVSALYPWLQ